MAEEMALGTVPILPTPQAHLCIGPGRRLCPIVCHCLLLLSHPVLPRDGPWGFCSSQMTAGGRVTQILNLEWKERGLREGGSPHSLGGEHTTRSGSGVMPGFQSQKPQNRSPELCWSRCILCAGSHTCSAVPGGGRCHYCMGSWPCGCSKQVNHPFGDLYKALTDTSHIQAHRVEWPPLEAYF
jgi:hypothetical protein